MDDPGNDAEQVGRDTLARLEEGWNAADGDAFARPFAQDADFVDIRGTLHRGRETIAGGHQAIFRSMYGGSRVAYRVIGARRLSEGVILVHSTGELDVPSGPQAGRHRTLQSLVLVREGEEWRVTSFHNTLVAARDGGAG